MRKQHHPRNRVIIAQKQGNFQFLGWVYGRRLREKDLTGADKLEEWFRREFPRRTRGKSRSLALAQWRIGFDLGKSGGM